MIPEKTRRKKHTLGVLKRVLAIRARRGGRMQNSLTMNTDIDQKVLWRVRMVDPDNDHGDNETGHRDEPGHWRPDHAEPKKAPWKFYVQ
jgi:hypothetical protein